MVSILIGVNTWQGSIKDYLNQFKEDAGFTQYQDVSTASKESLSKLANFVSQSISSQSQALGTGGPSQQLSLSI